jgi:hypothetical protein
MVINLGKIDISKVNLGRNSNILTLFGLHPKRSSRTNKEKMFQIFVVEKTKMKELLY